MQAQTSAHSAQQNFSGILFALAATVLFSLKPVVVKLAYLSGAEPLEAITLLTLRMLFALPFYVVITAMLYNKKRHQQIFTAKTFLGISFTGLLAYYFAAYFDLWGLQYISAQLERMTLFIYPSLVALLGFIFFKQRLTRQLIVAILLTYLGISLMYYQESLLESENTTKGMILVGLAAFSFAAYMVFSKQYIQQVGSRLFTGFSMLLSSVFILAHFMMTQPFSSLMLDTELYFIILILALPCTVLPSYLMSEAIRRIGSTKTSITNSTGPMVTLIAAIILLGEPFSLAYVFGMLLIIFGVYLLSKS
ncbi:MAG: DMT family transporter [Cocleimonas sp.]|nr:DMT family transporter [Cocleimonas sp.]